ncbi:hypothetical protein A2U01_0072752, partial [Trifolium medium]|nr:hypothetical protein [Trifolium medium]
MVAASPASGGGGGRTRNTLGIRKEGETPLER